MIPNLTGAYFSNGLVQPPTSSHHSSQIGPFGPFFPSFLASKCFDDLDGSLVNDHFWYLKKNIENWGHQTGPLFVAFFSAQASILHPAIGVKRLRECGETDRDQHLGPKNPSGVEDHLLGGSYPRWSGRMKNSYLPYIMEGAGCHLQYEFPFWFQGDFDKLNHGMMGEMVTATWLGWCFFSNIFLNVYPENWEKWSKFDEHIFSDGLKSPTRFDLKWSDHWMNPLIRQRKVYWWMTKWNFKDLNMVDLQFFLRVRIGSGTSMSWPLPLEIPGFGCSKSLGGNPGTMASWKGINVKHVTKKHEDLHPKWGQPKITQDEYIYI